MTSPRTTKELVKELLQDVGADGRVAPKTCLDAMRGLPEMSMKELHVLVEFATDQWARRQTAWDFSASTSPDTVAAVEAVDWEAVWRSWTDAEATAASVSELNSEERLRELNAEQRALTYALHVIEHSMAYHRTRPLRRAYSLMVCGIADVLHRVGIEGTAASLKTIGVYPKGVCGRSGSAFRGDGKISSADLMERRQRENLRGRVELGDAEAQFDLGGHLFRGDLGIAQDDAEAARWYRLAADQGLANAQGNLGFMYRNGRGVPQDDAEAVRWYHLAADQGDANAQFDLGVMYRNGRGVPQDDAEAIRWFHLAADQGDAEAQFNIGVMYGNGRGVPQDDVEAVRWYRLAVDQGLARAQVNLGGMYGNGRGVPQDDAEAVRWYRLAADQGDAAAQDNLGRMYVNGEGVPQDDAEAVRWYRLAADQGYAAAQGNLGFMYDNGEGVSQNYIEAHMWANLAAAQSSGEDRDRWVKNRDFVAAKMTTEQVAEAQRRAREWKPKP